MLYQTVSCSNCRFYLFIVVVHTVTYHCFYFCSFSGLFCSVSMTPQNLKISEVFDKSFLINFIQRPYASLVWYAGAQSRFCHPSVLYSIQYDASCKHGISGRNSICPSVSPSVQTRALWRKDMKLPIMLMPHERLIPIVFCYQKVCSILYT